MLKSSVCGLVVAAGLCSLVMSAGCASKRAAAQAPAGRVYRTVAPEDREYNPGTESPAEPHDAFEAPLPVAPPVPGASDPPPPTRSTSDFPPAPPRDDFESAEQPGRSSARYFPFGTKVRSASRTTK